MEPVVGRVVDPPKGERGTEVIAFAGMVVDHVEEHLDAGLMEPLDHGLEFGDLATRQHRGARGKPDIGREVADRVVAPVVGQPRSRQPALGRNLVDRQQLDCGDAEALSGGG